MLLSSNENVPVLAILPSTKPEHSPIPATVKGINSIHMKQNHHKRVVENKNYNFRTEIRKTFLELGNFNLQRVKEHKIPYRSKSEVYLQRTEQNKLIPSMEYY